MTDRESQSGESSDQSQQHSDRRASFSGHANIHHVSGEPHLPQQTSSFLPQYLIIPQRSSPFGSDRLINPYHWSQDFLQYIGDNQSSWGRHQSNAPPDDSHQQPSTVHNDQQSNKAYDDSNKRCSRNLGISLDVKVHIIEGNELSSPTTSGTVERASPVALHEFPNASETTPAGRSFSAEEDLSSSPENASGESSYFTPDELNAIEGVTGDLSIDTPEHSVEYEPSTSAGIICNNEEVILRSIENIETDTNCESTSLVPIVPGNYHEELGINRTRLVCGLERAFVQLATNGRFEFRKVGSSEDVKTYTCQYSIHTRNSKTLYLVEPIRGDVSCYYDEDYSFSKLESTCREPFVRQGGVCPAFLAVIPKESGAIVKICDWHLHGAEIPKNTLDIMARLVLLEHWTAPLIHKLIQALEKSPGSSEEVNERIKKLSLRQVEILCQYVRSIYRFRRNPLKQAHNGLNSMEQCCLQNHEAEMKQKEEEIVDDDIIEVFPGPK
ncbi:hypothetical protein GCK32_001587 [Trichostrongylus colubriformis]|uniref:Uncharacterized protein n=1 Tax=Trichostrongylus colubriformis TaxID=6319 RepID=A0AAN8F753_TRICO